MAHTRTLIREHLARELVRRGAWADAVYVGRSTPIDGDSHFPNVCVYTPSERTRGVLSDQVLEQELSLQLEVRARRESDMLQPWRHVDGLPAHPALAADADRSLDDACEALERIVFALYSNCTLTIEGTQIWIDQVAEVNTEINHSADGEVPFTQAQIEFKLIYRSCYPAPDPQACPLEKFFGEIQPVTCNPLASASPMRVSWDNPAGTAGLC